MTDRKPIERVEQRATSTPAGSPRAPRRPYSKPSLHCFGGLAEITRSPGLQFGNDPLNSFLGSRSTS